MKLFNLLAGLTLLSLDSTEVAAFWRMPCAGPVVTERADPVVSPGLVSGHVHTVMGASNFNYTTTFKDLRASTCTSCEIAQDLSSYWVPSLYYHNKLTNTYTDVKQIGGMLVYYIQRYSYTGEQLYAFPDGFRMLAGNPNVRSYLGTLESQAISYHCLNYSDPAIPETHNFPSTACPDGLRQQIFFPSCWDGVNVDSSDHKSHVAYPSASDSGTCPSTHPYRLVSLFYEVIWDTYPYYDKLTAGTGELVLSNGDPTGYSSHADFVNGWDNDLLQRAVDTCLNDSGVFTDCPLFNVIPEQTAAQCKKTPQTNEVLTGTLSALPGNNPVQYGPANAVMNSYVSTIPSGAIISPSLGIADSSIRNTTQFPKAISITAKGCYADGYPFTRTMGGLGQYGIFSTASMTNSLCSQYCLAQGFAYSGTEYSDECFCSNSLPPTALSSSSCNSACAGDASTFCGGNNALSVSYNPAGAKYISAASSTVTTSAASSSSTGYTTSGTCNGATFTSGSYVCWGGKLLCPVSNKVVNQACSGACYDPTIYSCVNGFLQPASTTQTTKSTVTSITPSPTKTTVTVKATTTMHSTVTRLVRPVYTVFPTTTTSRSREVRPVYIPITTTTTAKPGVRPVYTGK
ncbi:WSC domain protein [Taphrina deformans PYCC 5710]|uniref:WSC domain protein n=1 Tax=Taphrina deformans (strain PYCC 5710 / ATCC 11124 / CBS 356.35 / IMI 108563 / JCM 9778 / NBRC 8474) TaxID=1097556 RepID=R4XFZ1_TAPDE|nr:WSC domain protein [Taphrina deformans PYCC 5710]|eukprot:CCG82299.1 WSC domain protein [Taphrina deformans PYCC 5710]